MSLVPGVCTQCGAKLEVDPSKEAAVCGFCGTPFITEKVINNYNTTNVTNIGNLHADVVNVSDEKSIDNRVKAAETFMKLNKYMDARKIFQELTEECPYDYRGWWGLISIETDSLKKEELNKKEILEADKLYASATTVASDVDKEKMRIRYTPYIMSIKKRYEERKADYERHLRELNAEAFAKEKKNQAERKRLQKNLSRNKCVAILIVLALFFQTFILPIFLPFFLLLVGGDDPTPWLVGTFVIGFILSCIGIVWLIILIIKCATVREKVTSVDIKITQEQTKAKGEATPVIAKYCEFICSHAMYNNLERKFATADFDKEISKK